MTRVVFFGGSSSAGGSADGLFSSSSSSSSSSSTAGADADHGHNHSHDHGNNGPAGGGGGIGRVKLWNVGDTPPLYLATVTLISGGEPAHQEVPASATATAAAAGATTAAATAAAATVVIDAVSTRIGIRSAVFEPQRGFVLVHIYATTQLLNYSTTTQYLNQ
jgi:hypothetical protein